MAPLPCPPRAVPGDSTAPCTVPLARVALPSNLFVPSQGEKKSAAVRQLQSNRTNTGWEGGGGSKTVSLTLFLTCVWLWVLHYATLIEFPCGGVTWIRASTCSVSRLGEKDGACLLGDFSTEKFPGLWHPHWDDRAPIFKGSSELPIWSWVYLL